MCMGEVGHAPRNFANRCLHPLLIVLKSMKIPLFANFPGSLLTLHLVHSFTDCYMYVY